MEHPKRILERHGIDAKKSLGQNFLFDDGLLQKIVDIAEVSADDHVLEVGAGLGSLTSVLADTAAKLVTVELDNRLIPILNEQFDGRPHVSIIHDDILEVDVSGLFDRPYIVVANIPYYITGAILRHILSAEHKPKRIVLTVQKEVAGRMTAPEGSLSLLAISVRYYGTAKLVSNVAAGAFYPRPKVASSIVRIDVEQTEARPDEALFFRMVKAGFSQKRKQLKNNLRSLGIGKEGIAAALESADIDGTRRAETLTIAEWHQLLSHLTD